MARRRRRACIALFLVLLFAFGTLMGLRTLKAPDGLPALGPGLELAPFERRPEGAPAPAARAPAAPAAPPPPLPPRTAEPRSSAGPVPAEAESAPGQSLRVYSDLHAFYYSWYGSPRREGHYIHWDHVMVPHWDPKISASYPRGRHSPPDDLGSSFYPELGPYSSRDPDVLREHMTQLKEAAIGVLVLSWYPPGMADDNGEPSDDLVPAILDTAHQYNIQVAFHIQPYKGRDDITVHDNIKYIIDTFLSPTHANGVAFPLLDPKNNSPTRQFLCTIKPIGSKDWMTLTSTFRELAWELRLALVRARGPPNIWAKSSMKAWSGIRIPTRGVKGFRSLLSSSERSITRVTGPGNRSLRSSSGTLTWQYLGNKGAKSTQNEEPLVWFFPRLEA
uniref:Mannosidase endo-alpha like n=1 Tax=Urocitellus parryii TaxID=9999 RepID=A0A8D2I1K5_UROPR